MEMYFDIVLMWNYCMGLIEMNLARCGRRFLSVPEICCVVVMTNQISVNLLMSWCARLSCESLINAISCLWCVVTFHFQYVQFALYILKVYKGETYFVTVMMMVISEVGSIRCIHAVMLNDLNAVREESCFAVLLCFLLDIRNYIGKCFV